jgi:hypothetical protein
VERIVDEALGVQLRPVQVAARDARAADEHLATTPAGTGGRARRAARGAGRAAATPIGLAGAVDAHRARRPR